MQNEKEMEKEDEKEIKYSILRAGFEPATYGCLKLHHLYSPPLYQLSYRRVLEGKQTTNYPVKLCRL